jgi:hypothetical protein
VFDSVPASRRLVVGTGSLVPSEREQDLMKFRILFEAFGRLHYDVVHLTGRDVEMAGRLGLLADPKPPFSVLRAGEGDQTAVFNVTVGGDHRQRCQLAGRCAPPPAFAQPQEPDINIRSWITIRTAAGC